jgi:hypothetical protein
VLPQLHVLAWGNQRGCLRGRRPLGRWRDIVPEGGACPARGDPWAGARAWRLSDWHDRSPRLDCVGEECPCRESYDARRPPKSARRRYAEDHCRRAGIPNSPVAAIWPRSSASPLHRQSHLQTIARGERKAGRTRPCSRRDPRSGRSVPHPAPAYAASPSTPFPSHASSWSGSCCRARGTGGSGRSRRYPPRRYACSPRPRPSRRQSIDPGPSSSSRRSGRAGPSRRAPRVPFGRHTRLSPDRRPPA